MRRMTKIHYEIARLLTSDDEMWDTVEDWFQEVWFDTQKEDEEGVYHDLLDHRTLTELKKRSELHESELVEGMRELFRYLYMRDVYVSPW